MRTAQLLPFALFGTAIAIPLQVQERDNGIINKRDFVTKSEIVWTTTTVWSTEFVWETGTPDHGASGFEGNEEPKHASTKPKQHPTHVKPTPVPLTAAPPVPTSAVSSAAPPPPPSPTPSTPSVAPAPVPTASSVPPPPPVSSSTSSVSVAPVESSAPAPVPSVPASAPAPAASSPAPVASAPAPAQSSSSGGSGAPASGGYTGTTCPPTTNLNIHSSAPWKDGSGTQSDPFFGEATFYTTGMGSCGTTSSDSDMIVALSAGYMQEEPVANPNANPKCGKSITIKVGSTTRVAKIVDTCPGCYTKYDLDMSPSLFQEFANENQGRVCGIQWWFN